MTRTLAAIAAFFMTLLYAILFIPSIAKAENVVSEMSAANGVNEIVLTVDPCPLEENHGFEMYAYILEEEMTVAEGCWKRHEKYVDIWVPAIKSHFQLRAEEFTPREFKGEF